MLVLSARPAPPAVPAVGAITLADEAAVLAALAQFAVGDTLVLDPTARDGRGVPLGTSVTITILSPAVLEFAE